MTTRQLYRYPGVVQDDTEDSESSARDDISLNVGGREEIQPAELRSKMIIKDDHHKMGVRTIQVRSEVATKITVISNCCRNVVFKCSFTSTLRFERLPGTPLRRFGWIFNHSVAQVGITKTLHFSWETGRLDTESVPRMLQTPHYQE